MVFARASLLFAALFVVLPFGIPVPLEAQEQERIWGRVTTVTGEVHRGFIRWDRNEGGWADLLDGNKDFTPFLFQDWWDLVHPEDRQGDRVIELNGYRITWDDDEPEFPESHESGIRFGHIKTLTVAGDDQATLELRSGRFLDLNGGSTDIGDDLREVLVARADGSRVELEWGDIRDIALETPPSSARPEGRRLHGTVVLDEDTRFTGYIAWDMEKILTSDTLQGFTSDGSRRDLLFGRITELRPSGRGSELTLADGATIELFESDDVDEGNDGIQVSDPGMGLVLLEWDELERVRFHPPEVPISPGSFDTARRLRGTVTTTDSTELTGWIRWDGDEEYSWELLDGQDGDLIFDIEFGLVASIDRFVGVTTSVEVGATGVNVQTAPTEGATVTLRDGRAFELDGSNDVDDGNSGIFLVLDSSGQSPDDAEAEWVLVKWEDFRSVEFEWEDGR
ncbi:MAG: hypothetical protein HKO65_01335 [Gemmatimonadetes bacterium]|nr:hypothetical protein [Gemmatimonadota bacterium]NNM03716.1 hypothetical protein [Gemmatimonadota bacterium]